MPHAVAKINDKVLAETDSYEYVEGNVYFPPSSVDKSYLSETSTHTKCFWKGTASYFTVSVDGKDYEDAAWVYPEPKRMAQNIKDHVAFYKNKVTVEKS